MEAPLLLGQRRDSDTYPSRMMRQRRPLECPLPPGSLIHYGLWIIRLALGSVMLTGRSRSCGLARVACSTERRSLRRCEERATCVTSCRGFEVQLWFRAPGEALPDRSEAALASLSRTTAGCCVVATRVGRGALLPRQPPRLTAVHVQERSRGQVVSRVASRWRSWPGQP